MNHILKAKKEAKNNSELDGKDGIIVDNNDLIERINCN